MIANEANLDLVFRGLKANYTDAYMQAEVHWPKIAMSVPSTGREETCSWIGVHSQMREWIGPRQIYGLEAHGFTIKNRKCESTISVLRDHVSDDKLGVFTPAIMQMGDHARMHPEELIFALLAQGFDTLCYDGQTCFDRDHVVGDGGEQITVSNMQAGSETPRFLLDTSRPVKPVIWQEREKYEFTSMTRPEDDGVFMQDDYLYGVRARVNAGFGLWQVAFGSKHTLNATNYAAARAAMLDFRSDNGRVLGIKPTPLVVPPALEEAALEIVNADRNAAGATNVWRDTAELIVTPFLAP